MKKITDKMINDLRNGNELKGAVLDWLESEDVDYRLGQIEDLLTHGCVSGMVGSLIYYTDTCKFYADHKAEIYSMAEDQSENIGYKNAFELFANLNGAENVGSIDQLENLLAWYGFEEMARQIADELELEI